MKAIIWLLISLICIFVGLNLIVCDENGGGGGGGGGGDGDFTFAVQVFDKDGLPVTGAEVYLDGEMLSGTTGTDGTVHFSLNSVPEAFGLTVQRDGYLPNSQRVRSDTNSSRLVVSAWLMPVGTSEQIDAGQDSTVNHDGATVEIHAGSFVDQSGQAVTGLVDIEFTYVAPGPDLRTVGNFEIEGNPDRMLVSFGVVSVNATQNGQDLELASGVELEVSIPQFGGSIKSKQGGKIEPLVDLQPPLWRRNPTSGMWELLVQVWDPINERWVTRINMLRSVFNCDLESELTCTQGYIRDANGNPLAGVVIVAHINTPESFTLPGYSIQTVTSAYDGLFCLEMPNSSTMQLTVTCPDGQEYTTGVQEAEQVNLRCSYSSCFGSDFLVVECCFTDHDCPNGSCINGQCVSEDTGNDSCTIEQLCEKEIGCNSLPITYDECLYLYTEYAPIECDDWPSALDCTCPCITEQMNCEDCKELANNCAYEYCGGLIEI